MGPDHQRQPMLAVPKQLSPAFNKHHSVAPTPKTGPPFFSDCCRAQLCRKPAELCDLAYPPFFLLVLPFPVPFLHIRPPAHHTMFSRAVRISRAAPLRAAQRAQAAASIAARRTVTTNAASAQVDKSSIPEVS